MLITKTTTRIVYNRTGGGIRHHLITEQNTLETIVEHIESNIGDFTAPGTAFFHDFPFAFMSVHGAADGNHLYTNPGNRMGLPVGNTPINMLVVYAPLGGIGVNGGPGVWVDAFNVDTGGLSDSPTFMQVFTEGSLDTAATTLANVEGEVSSVTAEDMRANPTVDGVPFLQWEKLGDPNMIVPNPDYMLVQNERGIAFAFYQSPPATPVTPPVTPPAVPYGTLYEIAPDVWVNLGWGLGGHTEPGGSGEPHPEWTTLSANLLSTLGILSISSNMTDDVKALAVDLAVKHLYSLAESIKTMEIK